MTAVFGIFQCNRLIRMIKSIDFSLILDYHGVLAGRADRPHVTMVGTSGRKRSVSMSTITLNVKTNYII